MNATMAGSGRYIGSGASKSEGMLGTKCEGMLGTRSGRSESESESEGALGTRSGLDGSGDWSTVPGIVALTFSTLPNLIACVHRRRLQGLTSCLLAVSTMNLSKTMHSKTAAWRRLKRLERLI